METVLNVGASLLGDALGGGGGSAPSQPDYRAAEIAKANASKYNEIGPYGTVGWALRPGADPNNPQPGDSIRTTTLSPVQQALFDAFSRNQATAGDLTKTMFGDLTGGRQQMQDSIYNRATQYYDRRFGDREKMLQTQLQNQGVMPGSEAWNRAMQQLSEERNSAYADATDRAITGADSAQSNALERIARAMALSQGTVPTSANGNVSAPDFSSAASASYKDALNAYNAGAGERTARNQLGGQVANAIFDWMRN